MVRRVDSDWRCRDCGVDTEDTDEYYMVTDPVWDQATRGEIKGHLCIGCLERRLGRPLRANDFTNRDITTTDQLRRSPRLTARLQDREVWTGSEPSKFSRFKTRAAAMSFRAVCSPTVMTETLIVTTTVDAPASTVFAVLADPAQHAAIDGTGWVRDALDGELLTHVDQMFRIAMYHDNHPEGDYEMANKVIALEPEREIGWKPGQAGPDGVVEYGGWTWLYALEPAGPVQTRVMLTYDWSAVPAELRQHIQFPPFPVEHLKNSLANLANLANLAAD